MLRFHSMKLVYFEVKNQVTMDKVHEMVDSWNDDNAHDAIWFTHVRNRVCCVRTNNPHDFEQVKINLSCIPGVILREKAEIDVCSIGGNV